MFSWSSVFSAGPQVPDRPPPEELVTRMLMLELTALLKHTEKQHQDRVAAAQRRRSSCVDYSWLATPRRPSFQLPTREFLELEELCSKIPPSQCGPVILRVRNLVTEFEPEVGEVSHLFRSVLCACLDEEELRVETDGPNLRERAQLWRRQHSRSLSLIALPSSLRIHPLWNPFKPGGDDRTPEVEEDGRGGVARPIRARSLPQISVTEHSAPN
ncbi:protein RD3 [Alosa sapidissima]|uniref:protein RD3 n=1 Tax=Alosa sapidissima TaxID=34773 RepID=UPI001C0A00BB|nr:protein RD3 [Alosa sapidissima]XP_041949244.1 protein RD3 [Alosa sapidissima]XP_041949245.1 protein RD3 [Alosa sapidissima]XP_041949246.1 protein RD3 [Alosa sapidissima]XP_041949247.1 protein RD3 [Alosa sapidissima]XP_041949248.1 protein RD3 [Alosa sapidissima]